PCMEAFLGNAISDTWNFDCRESLLMDVLLLINCLSAESSNEWQSAANTSFPNRALMSGLMEAPLRRISTRSPNCLPAFPSKSGLKLAGFFFFKLFKFEFYAISA
ncbi:MAG: hypothetical protein J6B53_08755, partial [Clostridia bacterium]|nr:hypothetical protein [Clostridia bacterium]